MNQHKTTPFCVTYTVSKSFLSAKGSDADVVAPTHASHPFSNLPPGPVAATLDTSTFFVCTRNRTAGERGAKLREVSKDERDKLWKGAEVGERKQRGGEEI